MHRKIKPIYSSNFWENLQTAWWNLFHCILGKFRTLDEKCLTTKYDKMISQERRRFICLIDLYWTIEGRKYFHLPPQQSEYLQNQYFPVREPLENFHVKIREHRAVSTIRFLSNIFKETFLVFAILSLVWWSYLRRDCKFRRDVMKLTWYQEKFVAFKVRRAKDNKKKNTHTRALWKQKI